MSDRCWWGIHGFDWVMFADELRKALGGDPDTRLNDRLADLIEPPARCPHYHSGRHYCSVHEDMALIDREALLALADEIETDGVDCYVVSTQYVLDEYARRIREACGEAVA